MKIFIRKEFLEVQEKQESRMKLLMNEKCILGFSLIKVHLHYNNMSIISLIITKNSKNKHFERSENNFRKKFSNKKIQFS